MKNLKHAFLFFIAVLALGCVSQDGKTYNDPQLKYLLLDHYGEGNFFFCDPDYYPIARENETEKAVEMFPQIQSDSELFGAILSRKGGLSEPFSDDEKLVIYREFKKLRAVQFEAQDSGTYSYSMQIGTEQEGYLVRGTVNRYGAVSERSREKAFLTCPICLSGATLIDTPEGKVRVKDVRQGMLVMARGPGGELHASPVLRVSKTPVPSSHMMVHLMLSDGREILVSPDHPTSDGRRVGSLSPGDELDGAVVSEAGLVPYAEEYTYDLLNEEGSYFANGIYLGSSLD